MQNNLVMTSSPHLRDHSSTQRIMQEVCLALLPAGIAGVIIFGWSALMLICVSVETCVLSEFVWEKLTKRTVTIGDWSAVVTGLLLAYNLPANAPWWLAVVGGVIAIVLVISSATSRSRLWTCRFRRKSSTCLMICRIGWG